MDQCEVLNKFCSFFFFFRISFLSSFVFLDPLLSGDLRNIGMEVGSSHFFKWKRKKNEIKKLFSLSIFDIISVQLRIPFFFSFSQTKRYCSWILNNFPLLAHFFRLLVWFKTHEAKRFYINARVIPIFIVNL